MWVIVGIVVVCIIVIGFFIYFSKDSNEEEGNFGLDDKQYREYVYRSVQKDFKPFLQQVWME